MFFIKFAQVGFSITRLVILARLLSPNDFGLLGVALLTLLVLETFSQTGFHKALIQKEEDTESYLDAAWTAMIVRGVILFILIFLGAPSIAAFFNVPEAKQVIQAIGLSFLISAFLNIGIIYFQKELEFKKQFIYQFSGTLANFIVAVTLAFILRNVWALVIGILVGNLVSLIASYVVQPYRPRLKFELSKMKSLFCFGKWVLGSSILVFIGENIDDAFVGKLLSATALGFYQMAYKIANIPSTQVTHLFSAVAFPAFSLIQTQKQRLENAYFRILRLTMAFSMPIAMGTYILAPYFTRIFLGVKWMPIVPALKLLSVAAMLMSIVTTGDSLFTGLGKPNFEFYVHLTGGGIILLAIYPMTLRMEISGTATVIVLGSVGMFVVWLKLSHSTLKVPWKKYFDSFFPTVLSSSIMAGLIYLSLIFWMPIQEVKFSDVVIFFSIFVSSITIYLFSLFVLQRVNLKYDTFSELKLIYNSLRNIT